MLDRLHADGRTLVISTHDMDFAYRWADRIAVFCAGRVLAAGAPETVFRDTRLMARTHLRPPLLLDVFDRLAARGLCAGRVPPAPKRRMGWRLCSVEKNSKAAGAALNSARGYAIIQPASSGRIAVRIQKGACHFSGRIIGKEV